MVCTWLDEICSSSCVTVLPDCLGPSHQDVQTFFSLLGKLKTYLDLAFFKKGLK